MRSENCAHDKAGSRTEADPHRVAGQGEDNGPGSCAEHQSETDGDCRSISGIVVWWHAREPIAPRTRPAERPVAIEEPGRTQAPAPEVAAHVPDRLHPRADPRSEPFGLISYR